MKKTCLFLFSLLLLFACNNKKSTPEVSGIKADISIERFEKDFFSLDSNNLGAGMFDLYAKYPVLLPIFIQNIIGAADSNGIRMFLRLNYPLYLDAEKEFPNLDKVREQIEQAYRFVKYYFPAYNIPSSLKTVVGPPDALAQMVNGDQTPDFLGPDFIGISLQFYLGKDYPIYNDEFFVNNVAPQYRSRRFSKEYIAADAMKLVVDDLFPDKSKTMPLLEQMVQKGKQWWLLDKFLPNEPDTVKTGYTQHQLDWCAANEGLIWAYMVKNEDFRSNNPATIQTYLGEGPFTNVFSPEDSPGNIGQWIGWQIVKKFVESNPTIKPGDLMNTPAAQIIEEAKYKPK